MTLVVLGIILLVTLLHRIFPDPDAEDAAGYVMPGTLSRDYNGWDAIRFNVYLVRHHYVDQPPIVHVAYNFTLFGIIGSIILITALSITLAVRKKGERFLDELNAQYRKKLEGILMGDEEFSSGRILDILHPSDRHVQLDVFPSWLKLLKEMHDEAKRGGAKNGLHHANLQNLAYSIGLKDYIEDALLNAVPGKQYAVIEYLRLLGMEVPTSTVSRLLTHKSERLRKAARQYYMTLDTEDAYSVLNNRNFFTRFSDWDAISLHNTVNINVKKGKDLLPFRTCIDNAVDESLKQHLIEEAGYWVDDDNMEHLMPYLHDDRPEFRAAIYQGIAHRRYVAAEPGLVKNYENESVDMRILIINTLIACNSGNQDDFFLKSYNETTSRKLKRELLRAMFVYSQKSHDLFTQLRNEAAPQDIVLFDHVQYTH